MATATVQRGRLGRLLCRALFVLAGAFLVTAAAWFVSAACASAETLPGIGSAFSVPAVPVVPAGGVVGDGAVLPVDATPVGVTHTVFSSADEAARIPMPDVVAARVVPVLAVPAHDMLPTLAPLSMPTLRLVADRVSTAVLVPAGPEIAPESARFLRVTPGDAGGEPGSGPVGIRPGPGSHLGDPIRVGVPAHPVTGSVRRLAAMSAVFPRPARLADAAQAAAFGLLGCAPCQSGTEPSGSGGVGAGSPSAGGLVARSVDHSVLLDLMSFGGARPAAVPFVPEAVRPQPGVTPD
jgi:hypothetical protein